MSGELWEIHISWSDVTDGPKWIDVVSQKAGRLTRHDKLTSCLTLRYVFLKYSHNKHLAPFGVQCLVLSARLQSRIVKFKDTEGVTFATDVG